jgi:hypothetical protein
MLYIKFLNLSNQMAQFSCFLFYYKDSQRHTQTSFTNTVFVFGESTRTEAVEMTMSYIDRCLNQTIFCLSCLSIRNVKSAFGCQGKLMEVKMTYFL